MGSYKIRFAKYEDIPGIMVFIDRYWKAGHILAANRDFFEYQHVACSERVNFSLAVDNASGEILCLCGFMQSCEDITKGSVWDGVWTKVPGAPRGIGAEVIDYISAAGGASYDFRLGARTGTVKIHTAAGYFDYMMRHYYRLSASKESFCVAKIERRQIPAYNTSQAAELVRMADGSQLRSIVENAQQQHPRKDYWYIRRRYFEHPVYTYDIWGLKLAGGSIDSILVTRTVHTEAGSALRIVDYLGEHSELSYIGAEIDRLIREKDCEYADIFCYGVKDEYLTNMGFVRRLEGDCNIIPNHFEPFVRENVESVFAVKLKDGFTVFKGDGDLDRPSVV